MPRCTKIVELLQIGRGIEPGKQNQAAEKAADMRLPDDHLVRLAAGRRKRPQSEQNINSEPHRQESEHARIAQHAGERVRRHAIGGGIALAPEAEWTAALERKSHGSR